MDVEELRDGLDQVAARDEIDTARAREEIAVRASRLLRRRRRRLVSALATVGAVGIVVVAVVLTRSGQGHESIRISPAETTPVNPSATTTTLGETNTTRPAASPTVAPMSAMGGKADPQLPERWLRCTNQAAGFSIGAPGDWYTSSEGPYVASPGFDGACSFFDPEPFEVTQDVAPQTIELRFPLGDAFPPQPFEAAVDNVGPPWGQVNEQRSVQVAGRRAVLVDYVAGPGVYGGLRYVCYIIDHNGSAFSVCTNDRPHARFFTFDQRRALLDQFIATLQFHDPVASTAGCPAGQVPSPVQSPPRCVAAKSR